MIKLSGFTLTEVLLSLCLMSTVSLALFSQQWRTQQLLNKALYQQEKQSKVDSQRERALAALPAEDVTLTAKRLASRE